VDHFQRGPGLIVQRNIEMVLTTVMMLQVVPPPTMSGRA